MVQPLWKTVWRFLTKLKIELPYDPAIPLLRINPEKTLIRKDTCTPMFIATLFTIPKTWKQPKSPISYDITYRRYLITDTNELISTEKVNHRLIKKLCLSKRKGGGMGK